MIDVMLDLETWGTDPGNDIRSIGACTFDRDNINRTQQAMFYRNVMGGEHYGLTRNPETVKWWTDQSKEAREALEDDPIHITSALGHFADWLRDICSDMTELRLWSHGENMDEPILRIAYQQVGQPVPWHYRSPRDTRTLYELAGMDPHKCLAEFATGTHHNALHDAICQAKAACVAFDRLNAFKQTWKNHIATDHSERLR